MRHLQADQTALAVASTAFRMAIANSGWGVYGIYADLSECLSDAQALVRNGLAGQADCLKRRGVWILEYQPAGPADTAA